MSVETFREMAAWSRVKMPFIVLVYGRRNEGKQQPAKFLSKINPHVALNEVTCLCGAGWHEFAQGVD